MEQYISIWLLAKFENFHICAVTAINKFGKDYQENSPPYPVTRLSFDTKIFETETETLKMKGKVSIPRSLETRCHTLTLNFVEKFSSSPEYLIWVELNFISSFGSSNINL